MDKVLITGAAGDIGTRLRKLFRGVYPSLRLSARTSVPDLQPDEEFVAADLADLAQVERAVEGVNGIIHMGGRSVEDSWEVIQAANIVGAYNLFEAARRQGVERVVFASTNHTIGYYRRDRRIDNQVLVRPDSMYGVSKAYGEALGAMAEDGSHAEHDRLANPEWVWNHRGQRAHDHPLRLVVRPGLLVRFDRTDPAFGRAFRDRADDIDRDGWPTRVADGRSTKTAPARHDRYDEDSGDNRLAVRDGCPGGKLWFWHARGTSQAGDKQTG